MSDWESTRPTQFSGLSHVTGKFQPRRFATTNLNSALSFAVDEMVGGFRFQLGREILHRQHHELCLPQNDDERRHSGCAFDLQRGSHTEKEEITASG